VEIELEAQLDRFLALVGHPPTLVNSHQHVSLFGPVSTALHAVLTAHPERPFVRRVREPWRMLARIPGARGKRTFLTALGRRDARGQARAGFPGNDWLIGVTNPPCVADADFLIRWVTKVPGTVVELTCHPGYRDPTLVGRDCPEEALQRRTCEMNLLRQPGFREAWQRAGFTLVSPSELARLHPRGQRHAA
jgi:predicted glycoside hydrolase/deacetylase ChbG (UPF0249 family)